jgi:hypothetical protein
MPRACKREKPWRQETVKQKFSWAANRHITRLEDAAYCLMGLFNVAMTPLYRINISQIYYTQNICI